MKKQILFNHDNSGMDICRTIKTSYHKISTANLIRGGCYGASGVLEIKDMQKAINTDADGNARTIVAQYGARGFSCLLRSGDGFGITGVMEVVEPRMMQLVGDRGNPSVSVKDIAFTVCSSPMSDRGKLLSSQRLPQAEVVARAGSRGRGEGWKQRSWRGLEAAT